MPPTLGIIAGEGIFPFLVARGAKAAGVRVVAVALSGSAWPGLRDEVDVYQSVGVARLGQWLRVMRKHGCTEAIMVGRVRKARLYSRWSFVQYIPDVRTLRLFIKQVRRNKRDTNLLESVANELAAEGFPLSDSTKYCAEHLATPGVMGARQPTELQWADIRFGYDLCTTISKLEIGQALAIADQNVIAVEALEGTDRMIERAGALCRKGGWTLIKVSNTNADMRIDVPSAGLTTIEKLKAAGAGCLVLTPGTTIILEKPKVLELADRLKIAVVGYAPE
ncbi:MAG: UDP-2,3-diacylglucosamine diphosphatase LpxI [Burkholderiales bacterium]|nr:UDP-2,3-diacylglucosamine diphosphatase LpxI [Phycisphaerae bacterium]